MPPPRRLSWLQCFLLVEAVLLSAFASSAIMALPFRWIAGWIGGHMQSSQQPLGNTEAMRGVQWAVKSAARRVPWKAECLVQALVARSMLKRRGIDGTLYLGVAKDNSSRGLKAHAWIKCGDECVTGGHGAEQFTVVSTFAFGQHKSVPSI